MQENKYYLSRIEWEGLQEKYEITEVAPCVSVPGQVEKIVVWRDENYKIKSEIYGISKEWVDFKSPKSQPGEEIIPFDIIGYSLRGFEKYELFGCTLDSSISHLESDGTIKYEADLHIRDSIKKSIRKESEICCLTEWYINGPVDSIIFPRITIRKYEDKYTKEREIYKTPKTFDDKRNETVSRDYMLICNAPQKSRHFFKPLGLEIVQTRPG